MPSEAFDLCKRLNGRCACEDAGGRGCDAIFEMLDSGMREDDERDRIEQECADAEAECGW